MIAYGIFILLLIKNLKTEYPGVNKPWYVDYTGSLGTFSIIKAYFHSLEQHSPGQGYFSKPSKSVLIMYPHNLKAGKLFGSCNGFKLCMGVSYLGSYIWDDESKNDRLRESMEMWEQNIFTIRKTAGKYPQESYDTMVRAIQLEWIFLQHVTAYMGDVFAVVERMIQETFLPRLFFRYTKSLSPTVGALSTITVKKYGLVLLN